MQFLEESFHDPQLQHGLTVSLSDVWSTYQEYQAAKDVVTQHNAEADDGQYSYKLALNHLSVEVISEIYFEFNIFIQNCWLQPKDVRFKRNGAIVPEVVHRKFAQLEQGSRVSIPVSVNFSKFSLQSSLKMKSNSFLASQVDYRTNKCLGPIKKQGSCGSCWAFTATTPVEFQLCNRTKQNVSLR